MFLKSRALVLDSNPALPKRVRTDEPDWTRLSHEHRNCLNKILEVGWHLVCGAAGCGKTLLLSMAIETLSCNNKPVLLIAPSNATLLRLLGNPRNRRIRSYIQPTGDDILCAGLTEADVTLINCSETENPEVILVHASDFPNYSDLLRGVARGG